MLPKATDGVPNEDNRWCRPTASLFQVKLIVLVEQIPWNTTVGA